MKSAITICLVPQAKSGPFVYHLPLRDGCEQAALHGFDAVEIFPPSANAVDVEELRAMLDANGLHVAAIGTGAGWVLHQWSLTSPESATRERARSYIEAMIDLAGSFGAPAILGSMQGRTVDGISRDQALAWLGEALAVFSRQAQSYGVPFLYEPLNRYETNLFNCQQQAASWLDQLNVPSVKLLCDLFHMAIEESDLAATLRACGSRVGHVHFADSNRRAIGLGHTPIEPIIEALRDIGYTSYLSAEILPLPDAETAARMTMESFRRLVR